MSNLPEESPIDREIANLVEKYWEENKTSMLLSELGSHSTLREYADEAKKKPGWLAAYLRSKLAHRVKVIESKEKTPPVMAAIPADIEESPDTDVDATLSRQKTKRRSGPRFHRAFWAAFLKELDSQKRRYVSVGPPPQFEDLFTPITREVAGKYEVDSEYIVDSDDDAAASIKKWLDHNRLDESLFLANTDGKQLPSDDLLGRLIVALTPEELKHISMPLDIVRKLRQEPA